MRLENPHSLSYQPITRVSAPSTTLVCVVSKLHDAAQWLKSTLTSGASLISIIPLNGPSAAARIA
jgi:hypothetical protein